MTRIPGALEHAFLTRLVTPAGGGAGVVGEKKPIPARQITFDLAGLLPSKFAALTVQSNDAVQMGGVPVARGTQNILVRDITDSANAIVVADDAATDDQPAGLAYNAPAIAASGDLAADIRALFAALAAGYDPASLCFITDANTATKLGTAVDTNGGLLFPNVGVNGGDILGVPVLVTRSSPETGSPTEGQLLLVDGSAVIYGLDGIAWGVSEQATVELSDAPTGEGNAPAAQSQQTVSLFQEELTAFKCVMRASWKLTRTGAVAVLTGI